MSPTYLHSDSHINVCLIQMSPIYLHRWKCIYQQSFLSDSHFQRQASAGASSVACAGAQRRQHLASRGTSLWSHMLHGAGIYTYKTGTFLWYMMVNVAKYSIHGASVWSDVDLFDVGWTWGNARFKKHKCWSTPVKNQYHGFDQYTNNVHPAKGW